MAVIVSIFCFGFYEVQLQRKKKNKSSVLLNLSIGEGFRALISYDEVQLSLT
jgi:hypothetical protein